MTVKRRVFINSFLVLQVMALYFAPINLLSNFVYRHIVLQCGADYVFSELILVKELDKAVRDDKLQLIPEDISRTIFQIGVTSPEEVFTGVAFVREYVQTPLEININMGCPQSTMQQTKVCGGLLLDTKLMGSLAAALAEATRGTSTVPSIKIRLGTDPDTILVDEYIQAARDNGVKKVYIHARTLRHGYHKPTRYEFFSGLREKYSDMQLVFNGDVDSFEAYKSIGAGDVLIARAGLSNPLVFEDIKNEVSYGDGPYSPEVKDPNLLRFEDVRLTPKKIALIRSFLDAAVLYNLRTRLYRANMKWLAKGVTGIASLNKALNLSESPKEAKQLFETWLSEHKYL
jgi:tRNA-dihydrouridine synthase